MSNYDRDKSPSDLNLYYHHIRKIKTHHFFNKSSHSATSALPSHSTTFSTKNMTLDLFNRNKTLCQYQTLLRILLRLSKSMCSPVLRIAIGVICCLIKSVWRGLFKCIKNILLIGLLLSIKLIPLSWMPLNKRKSKILSILYSYLLKNGNLSIGNQK